jgi:spoIIIJ-associated protein
MTEERLQVEATGETVGEAKWAALRELERLHPELDKAAVQFQVVSEGERGLLGVGYAPARVIASVDTTAVRGAPELPPADESDLAGIVREFVGRIVQALDSRCRLEVVETEESVVASCSGPDLGRVIGRHGQTIDSIQYLVNAVVARSHFEERKSIVVDAAGYRARREATLLALARRSAEEAVTSQEPVELEPMTSVERKVVHEGLKEYRGVRTASEGAEPNRYVVVIPTGE